MGCRTRERCEGDIYHVFARGTGRRIIFEDDADRAEFRRRLEKRLCDIDGDLYAWCLMGNHFHLVVRMEMEVLARFMRRLNGDYARWFNDRHGRSGHLLEARFGSEPVKDDRQLLAAVRYVHRNPIAPGLSQTCDYPWSSYGEYVNRVRIVDSYRVLSVTGGVDQFVSFHTCDGSEAFMDDIERGSSGKLRVTGDEAVAMAKYLLGEKLFESLPALPKPERDRCIRELSKAGLSIRQISLTTGVGRGTVQRAVRELSLASGGEPIP